MEILSTAHFIIFFVFSILIGASIGSFLNVCILRIPRNMSLSIPGSHCFHCGSSLGMSENIPVFGFFILKGKCKHCGLTYAFQYVWVEILFAIATPLFLIASISFNGMRTTLDPFIFISLITFFALIITVIFIDWKWLIIPDKLTIPYIILFCLSNLFFEFPKNTDRNILIQNIQINHMFYFSLLFLVLYFIHFIRAQLEFEPRKIDRLNSVFLLVFILINLVFIFFPDFIYSKKSYLLSLFGGVFGGLIIYIIMTLPKITAIFGFNNKKEFIGEGDLKLCVLIGVFFQGIQIIDIFSIWVFITLIMGSFHILYLAKNAGINVKEIYVTFFFYLMILLSLFMFFYHDRSKMINLNYVIIFFTLFLFGITGFFLMTKKWIKFQSIPVSLPMGPYLGVASFIYFIISFNIIDGLLEQLKYFKLIL